MKQSRRDFLKLSAAAAVAGLLVGAGGIEPNADVPDDDPQKSYGLYLSFLDDLGISSEWTMRTIHEMPRQVLHDHILQHGGWPLAITVPLCGSTAHYESLDALSAINVPCPCGSPHHWMVFYA